MKRAFTLVELLIVIGIIALLIGLLVPVVGRVRRSAQAASTDNTIHQLSSAIEAYYAEHHAYPGLFTNRQISGAEPSPAIINARPITQTENMVLSLMGGWVVTRDNTGNIISQAFVPAQVGRGQTTISPFDPKRYAAVIEPTAAGLPPQPWVSWGANIPVPITNPDSDAPEPMDGFPEPMPIIYLRAQHAAPGIVFDAERGPTGTLYQYNYAHLAPYGFIDADPVDFPGNTPLERFTAYFTVPDGVGVRQRDAYLLIAPGPDRKYGTADDQLNTGTVK